MSVPLASIGDLEARWRPLTPDESDRASVLIGDASRILRRYPGLDLDTRIASGALDAQDAAMVVTAMVRRAMSGPVDGVEQQSAGPFSVTYRDQNVYVLDREVADLIPATYSRATMRWMA